MAQTRLQLRTRARTLADQEEADYPTDAQYNLWLDEARREVWYDLVTAGWPVNHTTQSVTATGASSYALASGAAVFAVQAVYYVQGTARTPLPRVDQSNKADVLSMGGTTPASYEILTDPTSGTILRLYPAAATGTIQVEYVPEVLDFSSDADTWGGPARSDMLICLQAAAKGCRKEGRRGDAADLLGDYATLLEKVQTNASWLDQRNPARIRDVNQVQRDPFDYPVGGLY